ncbi:hypothetical protein HID58_014698 [Brassica napus]|uniref:Uncharacterized protein n=1 Tax=Brassica napus TaxID=3708 RepID=A0ABQ8DKG0_BRANA|nr:hypothetical protein HID58_014698 [Brassica napus]
MKRKKPKPITEVEPATEKTTTSLVEPQRHSSSSTIAFKEIPLCSIYYRLFENRQVPSNTTPYDKISMLSPHTPRKIRRCVLGLDQIRSQVPNTPELRSCFTSLTRDLEKTSFRSIKPGIQKKGASTSRRSMIYLGFDPFSSMVYKCFIYIYIYVLYSSRYVFRFRCISEYSYDFGAFWSLKDISPELTM